MTRTKVSKISREDLAAARQSSGFSVPATAEAQEPKIARKKLPYTQKLTDKEIQDFFTAYGYINHERITDGAGNSYIHIDCENFEALVGEFDIAVTTYQQPDYNPILSEFDFNKFVKYCKAIDVPVEQALADIITTDLLIKRFPAYAEAKGKHKQQQIDEAFAELPKSMKKQLATLNEKAIADNKTMTNKGVFGSFDKDVYMKTTYGEEN